MASPSLTEAFRVSGDHSQRSPFDPGALHPATHLSTSTSEAQSHASGRPCSPGGTNQKSPSQPCSDRETDAWSRKIILSLDGGGVRGYSSLIILKRLMYLVEQIELGYIPGYEDEDTRPAKYDSMWTSEDYSRGPKSRPSSYSQTKKDHDILSDRKASVEATLKSSVEYFKPHHYFDYIVGTSTGGLSAIMLGRLEKDVGFALSQYDTVGKMVFAHPRLSGSISACLKVNRLVGCVRTKYSEKKQKQAILRVIRNAIPQDKRPQMHEESLTLKHDEQRCKTFVVAYGSPTDELERPTLFRSYDPPAIKPGVPRERGEHSSPVNGPSSAPLWAVARATSAAPLYFKPLKLYGTEYCDGGIVANNPASLAYYEIRQSHLPQPRLIVTIGTGESLPGAVYKKPTKLSKWNIFKVLTQLATQSRGTHDSLRNNLRDILPEVHYFRFNVEDPDLAEVELDAWKGRGGHETKDKITELTKAYLTSEKVNLYLLDCAKRLVAVRRERAESPEWELYACRTTYFCKHQNCIDRTHRGHYKTRHLFREHAKEIHGFIVDDGSSDPIQCSVGRCFHTSTRPLFRRDNFQEFRTHLDRVHNIKNPAFYQLEAFEDWLSSCREPN